MLIVGLGNHPKSYQLTRHNIGFRVLNFITFNNPFETCPCEIGELKKGTISEKVVYTFKAKSYMNTCGNKISKVVKDLNPKQLLVIADDIDLPFGSVRLKFASSSGGHNGHKSVERHLGNNSYWKLKVGVDKQLPVLDHVLGNFTQEEEKEMLTIFSNCLNKILTILT